MADNADPVRPHRLEDHVLGIDPDHVHEDGVADHDHDHDHDADVDNGDPTASPLWQQDNLSLTAVGIDIGSAGTQTVFSRVQLQRLAGQLTSRYFVVSREALYQSPVSLTPYAGDLLIDSEAVGRLIDAAYEAAGIHPDDVDAGAVILTGEALRRENARAIAEVLAEIGGEFVCAAAGHHMEALLSAYGSGAAKVSHDLAVPVLNIDIGGGTTKLALLEHGQVLHTAALHLGGRLAVFDEAGRLTRLDPGGERLAGLAGFRWTPGTAVPRSDVRALTEWMADALVALLTGTEAGHLRDLWLTEPLGHIEGIGGVMFSGGVGEFVYGRETRDFGDLGLFFGRAVAARIADGRLPFQLLPAGECIRATALGASEYTVQLSGNTIYLSSPGALLPRTNLQVLQPRLRLGDTIDSTALAATIADHFRRFDLTEGDGEVALALRWQGPPSFARLSALARGIAAGLPRTVAAGLPLFLIFDGDIAQTMGALLKEEMGLASEVLALDGIPLWDFDYVDLGRVRVPSFTVPVTIKSLVFSHDPRMPHTHPHGTHHHHDRAHHHHGDHGHRHPHDADDRTR